jgi:hypothetical protein
VELTAGRNVKNDPAFLLALIYGDGVLRTYPVVLSLDYHSARVGRRVLRERAERSAIQSGQSSLVATSLSHNTAPRGLYFSMRGPRRKEFS